MVEECKSSTIWWAKPFDLDAHVVEVVDTAILEIAILRGICRFKSDHGHHDLTCSLTPNGRRDDIALAIRSSTSGLRVALVSVHTEGGHSMRTRDGSDASLGYCAAQVRYAHRRSAALEAAHLALTSVWENLGLRCAPEMMRLTPIDADALDAQSRWPASPLHSANFPWREVMEGARRCPRRFEAAIWVEQDLCGLCWGTPSRGRHNVTLKLLEGRHGPPP